MAGKNRRSATSASTVQTRRAGAILTTSTFQHRNISTPGVIRNDVALIYVIQPFVFNDFVWPACLPDPSSLWPPSGTKCTARGWGSLQSSRTKWLPFANDLQQLPMTAQNCSANPKETDFFLPGRDLCAGFDVADTRTPCFVSFSYCKLK